MFVSYVNECFFQVFADFTPTTVTKHHTFAYLTIKSNTFASFARVFFIFVHFAAVLVLSTT